MLEPLIEEVQKAVKAEFIEKDGVKLSDKSFSPITLPNARALETTTLQSLVDYIEGLLDDFGMRKCFIHVVNPETVNLCEYLDEVNFRQILLTVKAQTNNLFRFGERYEQTQFITLLQSNFVEDEKRLSLQTAVKSLTAESSARMEDNGIEQTTIIEVKPGINEKLGFKNPVKLKPFRTFAEVDQPASEFVLRLHKQRDDVPLLSLHEADNSLWKVEALSNVKKFFQNAGITISILS